MKLNILYNFKEGSWGGANQFLKALRDEFKDKDVYTDNPKEADVLLFNGYPFGSESFFTKVFNLKRKNPNKIVIYRLDGPISLYRGKDVEVDKIIALFNKLFADGIIFQSNWSREKNEDYFGISAKYKTVINNAPDNAIFNKNNKKKFNPEGKIKLVATSWSSNWRKGFGIYKYLDENLDFSRYEMTFVGNSPIEFKNIKWIKPVSSTKLAEILKQQDIYVTASQNDPCSNSLVEALSCDVPAVVLKGGGHSELVKGGGELFNGAEDIIEKIAKVAENYNYYQSFIPELSIKKVARGYCEFAKRIYDDAQNGLYQPKQVGILVKINFYKMKPMILKWKVLKALKNLS